MPLCANAPCTSWNPRRFTEVGQPLSYEVFKPQRRCCCIIFFIAVIGLLTSVSIVSVLHHRIEKRDNTTPFPSISPTTSFPSISIDPTPAPSTITMTPTQPELYFSGLCATGSCKMCEGECRTDSDCETGLACFQRDDLTPIPSCSGSGIMTVDYCYLPEDTILVYKRNCSSELPCGLCEGNCHNDSECEPGLACFQRDAFEPVLGCSGFGVLGEDYCYAPSTIFSPPTLPPSPAPVSISTLAPTTTPTTQPQPELSYLGSCSTGSCKVCEGDCREDVDCEAGLACFRRDNVTPIPGCSGLLLFDTNYCYLPQDPILVHNGDCSSESPCGLCEGDCNNDSECESGLTCFQRDGFTPILGCGGFGASGKGYCYEARILHALTISQCSINVPCGECHGPCNQNADCEGNLVCFLRESNEPVSGCVTGGSGDRETTNYCHEPLSGRPVTYIPGDLTVNENGLLLSTGLTSRIIAEKGKPVQYDTGGYSSVVFHKDPDAADVFETPDGGWIYVSNSEDHPGGVGAIRFDSLGNVVNYQMVAEQSNFNCGGGKIWWNTWLSCEEVRGGQVWETDPYGVRTERMTLLGGSGGRFESAAYYLPNSSNPTFYVTEDLEDGALRRFTPDEAAVEIANALDDFSELLHSNSTGTAKIEFLKLIPDTGTDNLGTFYWTTDETAARADAEAFYRNSEGLDVARGILYLTGKKEKILLALDLEKGTWKRSSTASGAFNKQPDQIKSVLGENAEDDILYFCEDGGSDNGVHGRDSYGNFYNILNGPAYETETTGLGFSPDKKHLYVSYQEPGTIFDITRIDGYPFAGIRLDIKYSKVS